MVFTYCSWMPYNSMLGNNNYIGYQKIYPSLKMTKSTLSKRTKSTHAEEKHHGFQNLPLCEENMWQNWPIVSSHALISKSWLEIAQNVTNINGVKFNRESKSYKTWKSKIWRDRPACKEVLISMLLFLFLVLPSFPCYEVSNAMMRVYSRIANCVATFNGHAPLII